MKKKLSKTIRTNKALASLLSLLLILSLSSIILVLNNGLHFSELNRTYVVRVEGEQSIEPFLELSNISQIDEVNKEILIEYSNFGEVENKVQEIINEKGVNSEFVKVIERSANGNLQDIVTNIAIIALVATTVTTLLIYYSQRSIDQTVSNKSITLIASLLLSSAFLATVMALATLSLLSRIYRIKLLDVQLLLIIPVLVCFIIIYNFSRRNLIQKLIEFTRSSAYLIVLALILLIVPVAVGMGSQAVVPLLLIIIFTIETFVVLLIMANLNLQTIKTQLASKNVQEEKNVKSPKVKKASKTKSDRTYKTRRKKNTKK